jgi:hypothetical protein
MMNEKNSVLSFRPFGVDVGVSIVNPTESDIRSAFNAATERAHGLNDLGLGINFAKDDGSEGHFVLGYYLGVRELAAVSLDYCKLLDGGLGDDQLVFINDCCDVAALPSRFLLPISDVIARTVEITITKSLPNDLKWEFHCNHSFPWPEPPPYPKFGDAYHCQLLPKR